MTNLIVFLKEEGNSIFHYAYTDNRICVVERDSKDYLRNIFLVEDIALSSLTNQQLVEHVRKIRYSSTSLNEHDYYEKLF